MNPFPFVLPATQRVPLPHLWRSADTDSTGQGDPCPQCGNRDCVITVTLPLLSHTPDLIVECGGACGFAVFGHVEGADIAADRRSFVGGRVRPHAAVFGGIKVPL